MNWKMQAHGSAMMQAAAVMAIRNKLKVIAPIHDALLLEAPVREWREHANQLETLMVKASEFILPGGMSVPVDGADKPIIYPDRYMDEGRGRETWDRVMSILDRLEGPEERCA
jgi:hypothetical protein